jgi:N-acetyl-anhydromuramyl-L-alanine amidase AmpD
MPGKLNLNEIIKVNFPDNQYYRETTPKKQIVLHHTVSGRGVEGDVNWWLQTPERIATHIIINYDGTIYQNYSSYFWGHHLGIKASYLKNKGFNDYNARNELLNKESIAVELDRWGGLIYNKNTGKYHPPYFDQKLNQWLPRNTNPINDNDVVILTKPYRGYRAFEKYTQEQIESLRKLLVYWGDRYNIPLNYNSAMWDVSIDALSGTPGIWSHSSYRHDKSDAFPQDELILMLNNLNN